jgi:hypothetical protein
LIRRRVSDTPLKRVPFERNEIYRLPHRIAAGLVNEDVLVGSPDVTDSAILHPACGDAACGRNGEKYAEEKIIFFDKSMYPTPDNKSRNARFLPASVNLFLQFFARHRMSAIKTD